MSKYNVIDLFSGAGGFSAGFAMVGYTVLGSIEKMPIFSKTHHENFKNSIAVDKDITQFSPEDFSRYTGIKKGALSVIIGSPPCQTFSTIGVPKINSISKKGIVTDPRNYLFKYYFDYVDFYRPEIFIMENVPTMKSRYNGELFNRVLELVNDMDYTPHVFIANSAEYGVPQTRKRLILVGTSKGLKFTCPKTTHYLENKIDGLVPATTVYDGIADLPKIYDGCREDELQYSKTEGLTSYQKTLRNESGYVRNNICRMSNSRAKQVFRYMKQGSKYMDLDPDVRKILPFREDIFHDRLKRLDMTKPSWTVLAHIGMDGYMYIHPTENRTLSVREAARLQGFHDSFVFKGNMREQYIQVGNAVPPLLAKAFAESIKKALR